MKKISLLLFAYGISFSLSAQDGGEIAKKSANAVEYESMEMSATLKIFDHKGNVRQRQLSVATNKFTTTTKTVMRFLAPPDVKGTAMLIFDYDTKSDDMWIFLPSTRKTRRIISTEKGKSFMGSEFSNADMSKPNIDDFNYKILGDANINGKNCWKLETICKNETIEDENGYSKKISYVDISTFLSYKIEYYDLDGKLFKTLTYSDYRKQSSGRYFAFRMNAENMENKRKSEMIIDKFSLGTALAENSFSTASLEK